MNGALPRPWTVDDFIAWERRQPERYEFVGGRIVGMAGGSLAHSRIKGNVFTALRQRLRGSSCEAFIDDPRVRAPTASMFPDVVVACGKLDMRSDTLDEPVAVVEVLSRTTADFDRGAKWLAYRELASLQHYVLVEQEARRVELYTREGKGWRLIELIQPEDVAHLDTIGAELPLSEIYEGVEF